MQYDVSNIFIHMGLDHQPSQPYYQPQQYQQPEQEDNDDEDEEEDEEDQDSDEEDWASSKLGGFIPSGKSPHPDRLSSSHAMIVMYNKK